MSLSTDGLKIGQFLYDSSWRLRTKSERTCEQSPLQRSGGQSPNSGLESAVPGTTMRVKRPGARARAARAWGGLQSWHTDWTDDDYLEASFGGQTAATTTTKHTTIYWPTFTDSPTLSTRGVGGSYKVGWTVLVGHGEGCPLPSRRVGSGIQSEAYQYAAQWLDPRNTLGKSGVDVSTPVHPVATLLTLSGGVCQPRASPNMTFLYRLGRFIWLANKIHAPAFPLTLRTASVMRRGRPIHDDNRAISVYRGVQH